VNTFFLRLQSFIAQVNRYSDIFLAIIVVMIISLMIVNIPEWLLDTFIAINMTVSITLLMIALYIPGVLAFSTFPSILLFTTLFRLALNVTTTKMILLHAHAGKIIFTFGNFVVGGNFIVGAVIFIIILIVQFIVVTKGSERVAEVAARFTLDAMPGKQMSIDADMRAGLIDIEQARSRRSELERESQLHGSMDGAMKFVKGDAIAGLIITAVNILAGVAIGVLQKGMEAGKALQVYSILTIGDGLISQIPALLISITAGIIVTRVSTDEKSALGQDIGGQLLAQPSALIIAGFMIFGFGLMPGFPKLVFLCLSLTVMLVGYSLMKSMKAKSKSKSSIPGLESSTQKKSSEGKEGKDAKSEEFSITVPLMVDVASSVRSAIDPEVLNDQLIEIRKALYQDLGVPFPGIHLRFNDTIADDSYQVLLQEVPISQGFLKNGYVLLKEKKENIDMLGLEYIQDKAFLPHLESLWVKSDKKEQLKKSKITFMSGAEILTYHLSFVLQKYAGDFIGIQETKFLLDKLDAQFPEIVKEVQRVLPVQKLTDILQRLVQENISIRNLRLIFQSLIDWGQKEKETVLLTEYVRSSLKRYISYKYSRGQNILPVYLLQPDIEEEIRKAVRQTSAGSYLALNPATAKKLIAAIKQEVGDFTFSDQKPVLLTSMDIRRYLRKLIEKELYELPVLSHQELTEEITVQPLGRIKI
jgi:type III secretion protein V